LNRTNPANLREVTSFESNGLQKLVTSDGDLPETVQCILGLNGRKLVSLPVTDLHKVEVKAELTKSAYKD
jgi:hypothetical protein